MSVTFKPSEFPTVSRDKTPNEHLPLVKEMKETGESRAATVNYKTAEDKKALESLIQKVQSAGRELGVSVRKVVIEDGKGKATVHFKTVTAIKRPRTAATEASESDSE